MRLKEDPWSGGTTDDGPYPTGSKELYVCLDPVSVRLNCKCLLEI